MPLVLVPCEGGSKDGNFGGPGSCSSSELLSQLGNFSLKGVGTNVSGVLESEEDQFGDLISGLPGGGCRVCPGADAEIVSHCSVNLARAATRFWISSFAWNSCSVAMAPLRVAWKTKVPNSRMNLLFLFADQIQECSESRYVNHWERNFPRSALVHRRTASIEMSGSTNSRPLPVMTSERLEGFGAPLFH